MSNAPSTPSAAPWKAEYSRVEELARERFAWELERELDGMKGSRRRRMEESLRKEFEENLDEKVQYEAWDRCLTIQ